MLFSNKSSLLVAVLTLGSALVRAQFQAGTFRIQNSEGQTAFVFPGSGGQDGTPVIASTSFPEGPASIWNIAPASGNGNEYTIENTEFGQAVTGSEGGHLVTTSNSEYWKLKSLDDGFYAIQQSGGNLIWTSVGPQGEDQEIHLEREDPASSAQRFAFVEINN